MGRDTKPAQEPDAKDEGDQPGTGVGGGPAAADAKGAGNGTTAPGSRAPGLGLWGVVRKNATIVFTTRVLVTYYVFNFSLSGATAAFNTNFGVWLNKGHGFDPEQVGIATSILGFGEMAGCLLTFNFSDLIGHKRAVYLAGVLACIMLLVFCVAEITVANAFVGIALLVTYYMLSEFCWITGLSFISVYTPPRVNKAISITVMMSCGSIGSLLGTAVAHPLYRIGGYPLPTAATSVFVLICLSVFMIATWDLPMPSWVSRRTSVVSIREISVSAIHSPRGGFAQISSNFRQRKKFNFASP